MEHSLEYRTARATCQVQVAQAIIQVGLRHGPDAMAHVAEIFATLWEAEDEVLKARCVRESEDKKDP